MSWLFGGSSASSGTRDQVSTEQRKDDQPLAKTAAKPTALRDWEQQAITSAKGGSNEGTVRPKWNPFLSLEMSEKFDAKMNNMRQLKDQSSVGEISLRSYEQQAFSVWNVAKMNGIQQLKVVEPSLSDPHVPDQPEWITKTTADPPQEAGPEVLRFPDQPKYFQIEADSRVLAKREYRKLREEALLQKFFSVYEEINEKTVNLPLRQRQGYLTSFKMPFSCFGSKPETFYPLHLAAMGGSLSVVRLLLKMRANLEQESSFGRTALDVLLAQDANRKDTKQPDNIHQVQLLLSSKMVITSAQKVAKMGSAH
eukprot:symbB.v1.2.023070.t1/scaffold2086.1/size90009/7